MKTGNRVIVIRSKEGANGLIGTIIGEKWYLGILLYKVDFKQDISKYINESSPTNICYVKSSALAIYPEIEDFTSLIDFALDTKDKAWFESLIHQKTLSRQQRYI